MAVETRRKMGKVVSEGDSLAVGSAPYLDKLFGNFTSRAAVGRTSAQGYNDLTGTSKPDTLIVQLGTNDTDVGAFEQHIDDILDWAPNALVFWVNISRPDLGGTSDEQLNAVLRRKASSKKNLRIVDWYHAVRSGKVQLGGDSIHATASGYQYRAKLIHDEVLKGLKEGTSDHSKPAATKNTQPSPTSLIGDEELGAFFLDIVDKDSKDINVRNSIIAGEITFSLDAPAQVTITVHDQARAILKSGALEDDDGELRAVDAQLDGWWFRLVKMAKQGDDMVFTFEDRDVAWLRAKKGPRKAASRARTTRGEYILRLIRSVKQRRIHTGIYQLHVKRAIAKITEEEKKRKSRAARKAREKQNDKQDDAGGGFSPGDWKKLGVQKGQLENIAVFLTECDLLGATDRPRLAGLVSGFGESNWSKAAVDHVYGTHKGVFQSDQIPPDQLDVQSHHFLVGGRSFLAGGAIGYAKANPGASPGAIALAVEISDASGAPFYDKFRGKADKILAAWEKGSGGTTGGQDASTSAKQYYKRYEFKVDKDENYWDAIQRMADEVKWRAWMQDGIFFFWPETALFKQPAQFRIKEHDSMLVEQTVPGNPKPKKTGVFDIVYCSNIDFDWDYRKEVARVTATCRDRSLTGFNVGIVGVIEDLGPLSNRKANEGRWLLFSRTRDLFSKESTLTLQQPMMPRAEPRSELATRGGSGGSGSKKTQGGETAYVKQDSGNGDYKAQTTRPDGKRVEPKPYLMAFLEELAGACGHTIYTNTFSRHKQFSSSNLQSDHWTGEGADLNTTNHGGNWPNPYGTRMAEEAFKLCGVSAVGHAGPSASALARGGGTYTRYSWKHGGRTYSVQVLWGPSVGHTDHVHIGVHP
jgi:hypothetical protein